MIDTWWWQAIGAALFLGVLVTGFLLLFEIKKVDVSEHEKSPAGNWTSGKSVKTLYTNYSINRQNQQRRKML
ncbi:hypothetical protein [Paenibacillus sp. MMS18-CY102]|uniref:hypothetical protein n=1 Tax=Paenibacillus sp. MMS18-CY102 TaxID=2682849 RepID=UPI0013665B2C|nr:hypothetical protein [Paenibacillus sp. MMS18-CY102]MWC26657.1 hypothetical protein [Paenibacillus sp. MMS18-CY102]